MGSAAGRDPVRVQAIIDGAAGQAGARIHLFYFYFFYSVFSGGKSVFLCGVFQNSKKNIVGVVKNLVPHGEITHTQ